MTNIRVTSLEQLSIEIINNKARHNLMDAKCRWRSDRLDETVSFKEKLEGKGEASFDTLFVIQSHAESMEKIVGAL